MRRRVHIAMGVGLALAVFHSIRSTGLVVMFSAAGSIMPDFDVLFRHRKLLHNIFALILFSSGLMILLVHSGMGFQEARLGTYSFAIGWASHILGDMMTRGGVWVLWPLSGRRYRLLRLRYDDPRVSILGYLIGMGGIAIWILYTPLSAYLREALRYAP